MLGLEGLMHHPEDKVWGIAIYPYFVKRPKREILD